MNKAGNRKNPLADILESEAFLNAESSFTVALGRTMGGDDLIEDLAELSPLLISGCTGSGKSMFLHVLIRSLISRNSPDELKLVLIDPKRIEFYIYQSMPFLRFPVACSNQAAFHGLDGVIDEINDRLKIRNTDIGNTHTPIVVIIDEYSDLILNNRKRFENTINDIAVRGKDVNIHPILSTSIPSRSIITRNIKNHFRNRMAFQMANQKDSVYFLDKSGAEQLLGNGDLLLKRKDSEDLIKLEGCCISEEEQNIQQ